MNIKYEHIAVLIALLLGFTGALYWLGKVTDFLFPPNPRYELSVRCTPLETNFVIPFGADRWCNSPDGSSFFVKDL